MTPQESMFFRVFQNNCNVPVLLGEYIIQPTFTLQNGNISVFSFKQILQFFLNEFNQNEEPDEHLTEKEILRTRELDHLLSYKTIFFNNFHIQLVPNEVLEKYQDDVKKQSTQISNEAWLHYFNSLSFDPMYKYQYKFKDGLKSVDLSAILNENFLIGVITEQQKNELESLLKKQPQFHFVELDNNQLDIFFLYHKNFHINTCGKLESSIIMYHNPDDDEIEPLNSPIPLSISNKQGIWTMEDIQQVFVSEIKYLS